MNALFDLLLDSLTMIGIVLMIVCLVTGLVFLLAPSWATRLEKEADHKFSLRRALKPVEIPRQTERFFYRHHRITGGLIAVLAATFLWLYLGAGEGSRLAMWLARQEAGELLAAWGKGIGGFLVVANLLALLLGVVMFVRPSALKGVESIANRWISTRKATRVLDSEHDPLGRFAMQNPRIFGGIVLVGSLFVLANLAVMMN